MQTETQNTNEYRNNLIETMKNTVWKDLEIEDRLTVYDYLYAKDLRFGDYKYDRCDVEEFSTADALNCFDWNTLSTEDLEILLCQYCNEDAKPALDISCTGCRWQRPGYDV